jgi:hypothetical protein
LLSKPATSDRGSPVSPPRLIEPEYRRRIGCREIRCDIECAPCHRSRTKAANARVPVADGVHDVTLGASPWRSANTPGNASPLRSASDLMRGQARVPRTLSNPPPCPREPDENQPVPSPFQSPIRMLVAPNWPVARWDASSTACGRSARLCSHNHANRVAPWRILRGGRKVGDEKRHNIHHPPEITVNGSNPGGVAVQPGHTVPQRADQSAWLRFWEYRNPDERVLGSARTLG